MYSPWYNVEDAIHDLVLSAGDGRSEAVGLASKLIARIYELAETGDGKAGNFDGSTAVRSDEDELLDNATEFISIDCVDALQKTKEPWTPQEFVEYLGVQLSKFEEEFSKYMASITERNSEYVKRSFLLLGTMLADGRPDADSHNPETTVLSFNNTNPFKSSIDKSEAVRIINVHGSLDEGIIFGIDGTRLSDNPLVFPFSKTYRVITAGTDFGEGAVRAEDNSWLGHATRTIKFYGHSLGEADYAYFQAIFDSVNLYASETKLIFYYKPHYKPGMDGKNDQLTEKRARNTMVGRVTRLLAEYGKTLDNEDHGKNLMHKLMIEGRLEVRLLRDTESLQDGREAEPAAFRESK